MANAWFETVAIAQQRAKKRLPASSYGAIVAGAEAGVTMRDNTSAFDELGFRPVTAGQPGERQMDTTIMGQPSSMPVMISPTGAQAIHPDGEVGVARAAANRGIPMGLSSFASMPIEDVVEVNAHRRSSRSTGRATRTRWSPGWSGPSAAGAVGMILTLDWSFSHGRDWGSPQIPQAFTCQGASPETGAPGRWSAPEVHVVVGPKAAKIPMLGVPNFVTDGSEAAGVLRGLRRLDDDARRRRGTTSPGFVQQWDGEFMVKGVVRADEARRCRRRGRARPSRCRTTAATTSTRLPPRSGSCPRSPAAVGDDIQVLMDGGIRRGLRRGEGPLPSAPTPC